MIVHKIINGIQKTMTNTLKKIRKTIDQIPTHLLNKNAIAKATGYSPIYVGYLLKGERNSERALNRILDYLRAEFAALIKAA
jgi:hypothetical protein